MGLIFSPDSFEGIETLLNFNLSKSNYSGIDPHGKEIPMYGANYNNMEIVVNQMNSKRNFFFILIFILLQNCATSSAGMATSNIPIVTKKYKVIGPVEKEVSWFTIDVGIFGFPLEKPPIHKVVDEALKENEADALVNIRFWNDKIILTFITWNRFGLNAEAVKFETGETPIQNAK